MVGASPTTYVILDKDAGWPHFSNGQDFDVAHVVMRPSQCGTLRLEWTGDQALKIICDQCGLALSSLGEHASKIGQVQIFYENFPAKSFWE